MNIYDHIKELLERQDCARHESMSAVYDLLRAIASIKPTWANAPDWARWWAVDADGTACWHANRPYVAGCAWHRNGGLCVVDTTVGLPIGYDWRCTAQERPE